MIKKLNFKFSINLMIDLLSAIIIFDLLILIETAPYHIIWGDQLENSSGIHVFEMVSIAVNLLILAIIAIKGGYIRPLFPAKMLTLALWMIIVLFVFNTVGGIFSDICVKTIIFTPLTFLCAVLCYRIAIEKVTETK